MLPLLDLDRRWSESSFTYRLLSTQIEANDRLVENAYCDDEKDQDVEVVWM